MNRTAGSSRPKLVVVGNGMAAGRVLEELFARTPDRYDVTMFGAEPRVNYDRIMLSPVLAGEKAFDDIVVHNDDWYAKHNVDLRKGETVIAIDRAAKTVRTQSGCRPYDTLVIATGSRPILIPVPGADLPGVVTFRDLDDVNAMLDAAGRGGHAVVIGGGLLGLEAAAGLAAKGMDTTVVHLMPTLMERQLDPNAAYLLKKAIEKRGIEVLTEANTQAILGDGRVEAVRLQDGRNLPADLVVMAVGIRPHMALARDAGLEIKRGIVVDDYLRTSDESIYAIGECAEHRGQYATDWSRRSMKWPERWPHGSPARSSPATPARPCRPSSRSPASTCFPRAISRKATRTTRSCFAIRRVASTSASCCATTASSARCCMAIPPTGRGTSIS